MEQIVKRQRTFYKTNATKTLFFREQALRRLLQQIIKNESQIYEALRLDLGKSETESYLTEVQIVKKEITSALRHMKQWQRTRTVKTPLTHFPAKSEVYRDPYGVVLILAPWNYPFHLALAPLAGAVAAGNCVILKTSKNSPHVSRIIETIISGAFPKRHVYALPQGVAYEDILNQKYDFIFFTGSEAVGKKVMEAASRHVTPLVLELGGKSPCIVEKTADIRLAARRLAWGKFLNAGQTCVAPDYVLVDDSIKDEFLIELMTSVKKMYKNALDNEDYPRIISERHFERLSALIKREPEKIGGRRRRDLLKIEPTIFTNAGFEDEIMKEEIFGPILPIISYRNLSRVLSIVKDRPRPLALYIFSSDKKLVERVLYTMEFGGGCVNDVVMHLANHHLPFGGMGSSGMGNYHGKYSYRTFTHEKAVLKSKTWLDIVLRYPPYSAVKLKLIRKVTQ